MRWPLFLSLPRPARLEIEADALTLQMESGPVLREPLAAPMQPGDWAAALGALRSATPALLRPDVVIHAIHARLFMLPAAAALDGERRWDEFARHRFEQLHGEPAQDWWLRVVAEAPGRPRLVVAVPRALMETLREAFGGRLRSVWIDALLRLDELRRRERRFTGAAVDLGPGHALMSLFDQGVLCSVRLRRAVPEGEALRAALCSEWAALSAARVQPGDRAGSDARAPGPVSATDLPALAIGPADRLDGGAAASLQRLAARVVALQ